MRSKIHSRKTKYSQYGLIHGEIFKTINHVTVQDEPWFSSKILCCLECSTFRLSLSVLYSAIFSNEFNYMGCQAATTSVKHKSKTRKQQIGAVTREIFWNDHPVFERKQKISTDPNFSQGSPRLWCSDRGNFLK